MRSLIHNASEYAEELQRCIGDALEKCRVQYAGSYSDSWEWKDERLWYEGRIYVPKPLHLQLIHNHHDHPMAGHFGHRKTIDLICWCKHLNSELGAQTALHLSVSKGVIQRKRESWSSATSSSNDNSRPGPVAQAVHTGMKYVLFT